ncbi:hypothetical protein Pan216_14240 [Planctomycetes bacterium Pan216]|uniref:Uncharacterized protein n=1 Tax=Kolteria novifilia TaxID=2527975 RepID=A0A518B0R8_9BACT|nr:hypothetical protein Pan216_14240 [Planctomycetes bacterium Pan216]
METEREYYRPSGRVRPERFLMASVVLVVGAVASGLALHVLWMANFRLYVVGPILATIPLMWILRKSVLWSHCRSPLLAGGMAALLTGLVFVSEFYFNMLEEVGGAVAGRLDLLPNYILLRLKNDVVVQANRGGQMPAPANFGLNVCFLLLDVVVLGAIGHESSRRLALRPYDERCRQWMDATQFQLIPESIEHLKEALSQGTVLALADDIFARPLATTEPHTTITIHHVNSDPVGEFREETDESEVYLSADQVGPLTKSNHHRDTKNVIKLARLSVEEQAFLDSRLRETATDQADEPTPRDESPRFSTETTPSDIATCWNVSEDGRPTVLSPFNVGLEGVVAYFPLLVAYGLPVLSVLLLPVLDELVPLESAILAILTVGFAFLFGGRWWMSNRPGFLPNRYLHASSRYELKRRDDLMVEIDDPQAWFIAVAPRSSWVTSRIDAARDVGFLVVDQVQREIRFEGDVERWRIPAGAIVSCGFDGVTPSGEVGLTTFYEVGLRFATERGVQERLLFPKHIEFRFVTNERRRERAEALREEILSLMTPSFETATRTSVLGEVWAPLTS